MSKQLAPWKAINALLWGLLVLLNCTAVTVFAAPWGVVNVYMEESADYSTITVSHHDQFALHKVLANIPIRYAIEFEEYPGKTANTDQQWASRVTPLIQQAFRSWPSQVTSFIKTSGRQQEFQDIQSLLAQHTPILIQTDTQQADIVFHFANYKGAAFNYNPQNLQEQKQIRLPNPAYFGQQEFNKLPNFLLHEVGHYYGLGDRYQEGIWGNSPTYSSTGDTDSDSIMASSLGTQLTCDDVDGFINLIDITFFLNRHTYSPRAQKGWTSFCSPHKMYTQAKELNRAAFYNGESIYYYNADGSVRKKQGTNINIYYNPFAQVRVLAGPFTGTQSIPDEKLTMQTLFDYTELATRARIVGKTTVANLTFLQFEAQRTRPHQWDFILDYQRAFSGAPQRRQQHFMVQQGRNNTCRVQSTQYGSYLTHPQVDVNLGKGSLQANAHTQIDASEWKLQAKGSVNQLTINLSNANVSQNIVFKDGELFFPNEEDLDFNLSFRVTDTIRMLQKYMQESQSLCNYVNALP